MGKSRRHSDDSGESDQEGGRDYDERKERHKKRRRHNVDDDSEAERRRKRPKKRKHKKQKSKKMQKDSSSSEDESSDEEQQHEKSKKKVVNERLLKKLQARGETLEEREARRAERRAARITAKFGYTAEENPFNDPNLHETFSWKKKEEKSSDPKSRQTNQSNIFEEIEKVRKRRKDREEQFEEMERIRAEESRMKELEHYDEWARKEEEFHLQQQRQRSAIRLVEGREKPIDVLAKNVLMFGLTDGERENRGTIKYQERYNALNELETLEAELDKPYDFVRVLKLAELEELSKDIDTFRRLEKEASRGLMGQGESTVIRYWDNLQIVVQDEIDFLRNGGENGPHATTLREIRKLFVGQSESDLKTMRMHVEERIRKTAHAAAFNATASGDVDYWKTVLEQLTVHVAKVELSEQHNRMLVRQLERLEQKKHELEEARARGETKEEEEIAKEDQNPLLPDNVAPGFGDLEEELGLTDEVDMASKSYLWEDRFRPRKPRYFHRVKTGYDWNAYNKTHYDQDSPPPKIVQGYRFNVFYPDLIDKTKTPQFSLEPTDSDEFCIIRFSAGAPYEDIAFKIINREWNRSRKQGFRSTFERGVLTLYFNFKTHWYRR
jgi:hypothetical protein